MTAPTLITATGARTGKTAAAIALATLASDRGDAVGYMKPKGTRIQSTVGKTIDPDPLLAKELLGLDADVADLEPIVYSSTFLTGAIRGQEDPGAVRERVAEAFDVLAADADRMILEGGGSWPVGGAVDLSDPDVAALLEADVVLLARYDEVQDVDPVIAASNAFGDRLAGVVFNAVGDDVHDELERDVAPFLENRGVPVHGVLPRTRDLSGATVEELAAHLGARVLTDAPMDGHVERFHVGAMGGESALRYFRRTTDAAVITGGDRADVQTAAIEAGGVRCLVLTGGFEPTGAVLGKAEQAGVPVLVVQGDTLATAERAERLVDLGRAPSERTVGILRELLENHADVDAILGD